MEIRDLLNVTSADRLAAIIGFVTTMISFLSIDNTILKFTELLKKSAQVLKHISRFPFLPQNILQPFEKFLYPS